MKTDKNTIEQFRLDLPIIRVFAGWTIEDLANLLGISRATIILLEKPENKDRMSKLQYLAIQMALQEEIKMNGNYILERALLVLSDEYIPEGVKQDIRDRAWLTINKAWRGHGITATQKAVVENVGPLLIGALFS